MTRVLATNHAGWCVQMLAPSRGWVRCSLISPTPDLARAAMARIAGNARGLLEAMAKADLHIHIELRVVEALRSDGDIIVREVAAASEMGREKYWATVRADLDAAMAASKLRQGAQDAVHKMLAEIAQVPA